MQRKWSLLTAVLLFMWTQQVWGQEWNVPEDQSSLPNPKEYTLENVKTGKELYIRNCRSCHGDPGKNNPLNLVPLPVDIASERMHLNTEGGMYYKITSGRGVMPPFKTTLSEDERWMLVNFIVNYKPGGEVLLVDAPPIKARLLASVNEESASVEILAEYENDSKEYNSLANTPVIISSKKAFGNIEIGRAVTNENGRAEFVVPEDVIGDEQGYVSIVVSLNDDYEAGAVTMEKAKVGKLKEVPPLIKGEVLWSTNDNLQLWLLLSYIAAAGGAWLVIGYVIFQIVKIRRFGKSS